MQYNLKALLFSAAALALTACSDVPTTPNLPERSMARPHFTVAQRTGEPLDVPAVTIDLPDRARPWDTSDAALIAAIAAEDGHAIIGIKEVGSAQAFEVAGRRAAVSAATIRGGLAMLRGRGVEIVEIFDAIGAAHVKMPSVLAGELRHHPLVDYIEPRQHGHIEGVRGSLSAAVVAKAAMLTQTTPWGIDMVRAPTAWSVTRGAGVAVEIIDTGHEQGHEDLPYVPSANCAGIYGGCDDGYPFPHGSHVMGIFLARDNDVGVVGVANGIDGVNVYAYGACDSNTRECSTTEVTAGINAGIFTARVINMSLSEPYDIAQASAVAQAWANDIVLVAAAGNNGGRTQVYPARYTNVIGVSGVQMDKTFASTSPCNGASSNYGPHVDLAGPFWALSTVPTNAYADETSGWCGTSMATPHVSGTAALVRAQNPSWTNQQVVNQLLNTAEDRGTAGRDDYYGYGLVDAAAAVGIPRPVPLSVGISGPGTFVEYTGNHTWTAVVSGGTPPYAYSWTVDGSYFGNATSITTGGAWGGGEDHPITLTVTDSQNHVAANSLSVYVTFRSCPTCFRPSRP